MKKLAPLAAFAAVAALAAPVAGWADGGAPPQGFGDRIQERIAKVESRIETASDRLAELRQKLDEKCSSQPAAGTGSGEDGAGHPAARRCARAEARLARAERRLERASNCLARIEARLEKRQQNHSGSSLSASDQAALAELQQQLAGANA